MNLIELKAIQTENIEKLLNVKQFYIGSQFFVSDSVSIDGKTFIKLEGLEVVSYDAICDFLGIKKNPHLIHVVGFNYENNHLILNVKEEWEWVDEKLNTDLEIYKPKTN